MKMDIKRCYPTKTKDLPYPNRYPIQIFEKRDEIMNNKILYDRYKKYKDCINPDTCRKITKGGRLYNKIKQEFVIQYAYHYINLEDIEVINYEEYNNETNRLKADIDNKNNIINNENIIIEHIIDEINKLTSWEDYIEFKGNKYGIPSIYNDIHRTDNCLGNMVFINKTTETYSNDRPFMSVERVTTYSNYLCDKCNFKHYITENTDESIMGPSYSKPKYW